MEIDTCLNFPLRIDDSIVDEVNIDVATWETHNGTIFDSYVLVNGEATCVNEALTANIFIEWNIMEHHKHLLFRFVKSFFLLPPMMLLSQVFSNSNG